MYFTSGQNNVWGELWYGEKKKNGKQQNKSDKTLVSDVLMSVMVKRGWYEGEDLPFQG